MSEELIISPGKKPNAFRKHKKLFVILIIIACAVAAYFIVTKVILGNTTQNVTVPDTVTLEKQDLAQTVAATGNLQSVTSRAVAATQATSTYKVKEIYVSVGDSVGEGQPLCQLDTTDIEKQISDLRAQMSNTKAQDDLALKQAEGTRDRALLDLVNNKDPKQKDQLNSAYQSAQRQVDTLQLRNSTQQASQQLQTLYQTKNDCTITAPIAGTITSIDAKVGLQASGSSGGSAASSGVLSGLFVIQDLANLEIPATIAEYDAVTLSPGLAVTITSDTFEGKTWNGTVKSISPVATDTNNNFTATVTLTDPPDGLTPGMSSKMQIKVKSATGVFAVPFDAVVTKDDGTKVVYALEGAGGNTGMPGGGYAGNHNQGQGGGNAGAQGQAPGQNPTQGQGQAQGQNPTQGQGQAQGTQDTTISGKEQAIPPDAQGGQGQGAQGGQGQNGAAIFRNGGGAGAQAGAFRRVEIPVTTGIETDYLVQISGDGLKEGMHILTDPQGLSMPSSGAGGTRSGVMVGGGPGGPRGGETVVRAGG